MICFRCGSEVLDTAPQCPNCGQRFAGARRTFTATTTSFRALERRKLRVSKAAEGLPFSVGDTIDGRYEVRDVIGRGPLGVVFRVHDQEIELDVALKVMHDELLPELADRQAFGESVRRVRKLSQQNIVRIYDHAEAEGHCYFTMQLLEGLTLRKVMGLRKEREQRFSVREIEPIFNQITMALGHAHRHTPHGNVKPENILILPDVLKLTDFGASSFVARDRFVAAQTEAGRGGYLAPELVAGGAIDGRADIYSLGALLYELLTGRPFGPDAPPVSKVLDKPDEARPGGIDRLISQATAQAPTARFETAETFAEALGTYIDARELVSVDIRASNLLPEDITRKFAAPRELAESSVPASQVPSESDAPPVAPAEESFIEALSSTDLDSLGLDALESVDRSADPAVPIMAVPSAPMEPFGSRAADARAAERPTDQRPTIQRKPLPAVPPEARHEAEQTFPVMEAVQISAGPPILRSNLGFVLAITAVVGAAVFVALYLIRRDDPPKQPEPPTVVRVVGDASPSSLAVAPETVAPVTAAPVTAAPETLAAVPDAGPASLAAAPVTAAPATAAPATAAPESLAMRAPATAPETDAPRAPRTEAPRTEAPRAPVTEAPRTEAPRAPVTEAPRTEAPRAPETEAPRTEAPRAPATEAPATEAARAPATEAPAGEAGELRCPAGMILVRTGRFPKNSGTAGVIKGAEAVALARAGNAFCVDVHEFPGRGQRPRTSVTFTAAQGLCKDAGKRLCSDSEWLRACVGRGGAGFPYGKEFDALICNTEDENGDERSVATAGSFEKCRSALGAYDMSGNVAEWTRDQTVRGGDFASADDDAACRAGGRRSEGSARASIGFRCCSDFQEP